MDQVKMKAPKGVTGASHDAVEYQVDKKGFILVPPEAVAALTEHGFEVIAEPAADPAA
jgi:hypothetical protein